MSAVSSRVRESLLELHAHIDYVFRDNTPCHRASNASSSVSKMTTKFELERLKLSSQRTSGLLTSSKVNVGKFGIVDAEMASAAQSSKVGEPLS